MSSRLRGHAGRSALLAVVLMSMLVWCSNAVAGGFTDSPEGGFVTDGRVIDADLSSDGNTAYVGGNFSFFGPPTGSAIPVDSTGVASGIWPEFSGTVKAIEPDGSGGWYVGGSFSHVDGIERPPLVHVTAAGTLDLAWNVPTTGYVVNALTRHGTDLIIGGRFSSIGGSARNGFAVLNTITRSVDTSWPQIGTSSEEVRSIHVDGTNNIVYIGGIFTTVGGVSRSNVAAIDLGGSHVVTAWNPVVNIGVMTIDTVASLVYIGGAFTLVNGMTRNRVAAIDRNSGALDLTFNPNASAQVEVLRIAGASIYIGGSFNTIGGQPRSSVAEISGTTGAATTWNPAGHHVTWVRDILVRGTDVIVGGQPSGGWYATPHRSLVSLDRSTAAVNASFQVNVEGAVWALGSDGSEIYVGGSFTTALGQVRLRLAALDRASGTLRAWAPVADGDVQSIEVFGTSVYVGGTFSTVDGSSRRIAEIDTDTGVVSAWTTPPISGIIFDLEATATRLYVAGEFPPISDVGSSHLAALDRGTGNVIASFSPNVPYVDGSRVQAISIDEGADRILLGGTFTSAASRVRTGLALLVASTGGDVAGWNAQTTNPVDIRDVQVGAGRMHVAGWWGSINGDGGRQGFTELDMTTGLNVGPAMPGGGSVFAFALHDGVIFTGTLGAFRSFVDGTFTPTGWTFPSAEFGGDGFKVLADDQGLVLAGFAGSQYTARNIAGVAFLRSFTATDTSNPVASLVELRETVAGTSPDDGTFVSGNRVYVRPLGGPRTFTARVRANDVVPTATATTDQVSGLEKVTWPPLAAGAGSWTPGSSTSVNGAETGLKLRCWNGMPGTDASAAASATDAAIDYGVSRQPATWPQLPAALMSTAGATIDGPRVRDVSCRWAGYLIPPTAGTYYCRSISDSRFRAEVAGAPDTIPSTWNTINHWTTHTPTPSLEFVVNFAAANAPVPIYAEWAKESGIPSQAELQWDPPGPPAMATIPPAAFVTNAYYERLYELVNGTGAAAGTYTQNVYALDRAGRSATVPFQVAIDDAPPDPASIFIVDPGPGYTNAPSADIATQDGEDSSSGIFEHHLERRSLPLSAGACTGTPGSFTNVETRSHLAGIRNTTESMSNGCHQFRYRSVDNVGNEMYSWPTPLGSADWIQVDTTAPVGGSVSNVAGPSSASTVNVSYMLPTDGESGVEPNTAVVSRYDAPLTSGLCGGTYTLAGASAIAGTASPVSAPLVDGVCSKFELTVTNRAGTSLAVLGSNVVKSDSTAPMAGISASPSGPVTGLVGLNGTATDDGTGVANVAVAYVSTPSNVTICPSVVVVTGTWTCNWNVTLLADGAYTVIVTVTDEAGNTDTDSRTVVVDTGYPTITIDGIDEVFGGANQHAVGNTLYYRSTGTGSFTVRASASDPSGIASITFPALGNGWTPFTPWVDTIPSYDVTYEWTLSPDVPVFPFAIATDTAGNTASAGFMVVPDDTAPTGTSLVNPPAFHTTPSVPVSFAVGTDAGGSGIAGVVVERDQASLNANICSAFPDAWTSVTLTVGNDTTVLPGSCYRYRIVVSDNVGNSSTTPASTPVKIDTEAPTGAFTVPAAGAALRQTVTLSGPATDAETGVANVTVTYSGTASGTACSNAALAAGAWSCSWNTTSVAAGTYTLQVAVTDAAGNTTTTNRAVVVDNIPPIVSAPTITEGTNPQFQYAMPIGPATVWVNGSQGGTFTVQSSISEPDSGMANATFPSLGSTFTSVGGTTVNAPPWEVTYTWTSGATLPTPTPSTIYATDVAGNSATATFAVRVDTAPPVGGSITYPDGLAPTVTITFVGGTDAGSGVASNVLRRRESLTDAGGTCLNAWGAPGPIAVNPTSPYTDTTAQRGHCYQYSLRVIDNVGNEVDHVSSSGATYLTDTPGLTIVPTTAASASATEGGAAASMRVSLRAAPTDNITVTYVGDGQVGPASAQTITFTPATWATPQTVSVPAIDDAIDEASPLAASVTFAVASPTDVAYDSIPDISRIVPVFDNDTAGLDVSAAASGVAVAESGTSATYAVRLTSQPIGTVTVAVGHGTQATATPSTLSFDGTNWSTPRTVTVLAVDDPDVEGPHSSNITNTTTATNANDAGYASLVATVPVTIADDDTADFTLDAAAHPELREDDTSVTTTIRARLNARPTSDATVTLSDLGGQISASSALTFTPANWDTWQSVTLQAVDDTIAEPPLQSVIVTASLSSTDTHFGSVAPKTMTVSVRDDDTAAFVTSPGSNWTVSADGRLLLDEAATEGSVLRIRTMGDPTSDITITPAASPAGQLVVSPATHTIKARSHEQVITFSVRAVNDRDAELDPHPALVTWKVTTSDALYRGAVLPNTVARIKDGEPTTTREATPDPTPTGPSGDPTPTPDATPQPGGNTTEGDNAPGDTVSDDGSSTSGDGHSVRGDDASEDDGDAKGSRKSPAKRLKAWASEHKGKASVAASAAGTAALWGLKPLAIAGKALVGGGGGLPGHPPGLGQTRHLLKRDVRRKLFQFWRRKKRRPIDRDDDDWDDFFRGDRAA